jgi:soluble lytic murein transglycosylase-like protein
MQLMPATQRDLAVDDPYEPLTNIYGGTDYLSQLLATFDGDVDLATAAYNAGPEAVRRHHGIPPYAETQEYVRRVKILHRRYREAGA